MAPTGGGDVCTVKDMVRAVATGNPVLFLPEGAEVVGRESAWYRKSHADLQLELLSVEECNG
jgi:hypothetical protein